MCLFLKNFWCSLGKLVSLQYSIHQKGGYPFAILKIKQ